MVKTIESLDDVLEVIKRNPKQYSLGGIVREIVDLQMSAVAYGFELAEEEKKKEFFKSIENRLLVLYTELDRREKIYRGACVLPNGDIEGGKYF